MVLTPGKVRCSLVRSSRPNPRHARHGALRVAPGGSAPLGPLFAAQAPSLRPMATKFQAGTGSRRISRTGKPGWRDQHLRLSALKGDILALR
jgi:hypothetical protein